MRSITLKENFSISGDGKFRDSTLSRKFVAEAANYIHILLVDNQYKGYVYVNNYKGEGLLKPSNSELRAELSQLSHAYILEISIYLYGTDVLISPNIKEIKFNDLVFDEQDRKKIAREFNIWFFSYFHLHRQTDNIYKRLQIFGEQPDIANFDALLRAIKEFGNSVKDYAHGNERSQNQSFPSNFFSDEMKIIDEASAIIIGIIYELDKRYEDLEIKHLNGVDNLDEQIENRLKNYDFNALWFESFRSVKALKNMKSTAETLKYLYEQIGDQQKASKMNIRIEDLDLFLRTLENRR